MRRWLAGVAVAILAGCGASYEITRTAPDGTMLRASARTSESAGAISFTFDGDPAGRMKITLDKENVEPVLVNPGVLQRLFGGTGDYSQ